MNHTKMIFKSQNKEKGQAKKWTNGYYHVQKNEDIEHKYVRMYCSTTQFPEFTFCGPHNKPYGVHRLSKHYNIRFDTKIVHGTCSTRCIP